MRKLRTLDLFSGAGMFSLGLERTGGFETVAFCEIEPYARTVLRRHWPDVPIFEDVTKLGAADAGPVDVIAAGFPCQDLSVAGKGAGLGGKQSGLWSEVVRLAGEIRPRFLLLENVSALLSRGMGDVLRDLAALGYDAEWDCLPATIVGAPHNRDRIWIVAYPQRDKQPRAEPRCWPLGRVGRFEQPVPWDEPWESALARFRGMDDGDARTVDRTDLIRNSLVPQIPEMIGHAILEAEAAQ
jgi:DNA (cytosine-5)-methyltransferase 1